MRFKSTKGDVKIYAVAGTQTVLLSFDLAKTKVNNKEFIGFDIERKDSLGKIRKLNGSKHFNSLIIDSTITDQRLKMVSLVQTYFWKDYEADPGQTYTYTINAMYGTARKFAIKFSGTITVTMEQLNTGVHSVYFNYGVTGSQAYNKRFDRKLITELPPVQKQKAFDLLGRELWTNGLLEFIRQAQGSKFQLYCVFYEFQYDGFLGEIKTIINSGATVEIRYSAQSGQKAKNEAAIASAGIGAFCKGRTIVSQPHNKFMILCENNVPKQVWTGSTNLTLTGIFGHSNTGHWIKDETIAKQYFTYWQTVKDNPKTAVIAEVNEKVQADTDLKKLKNGTYVFFSPRKSAAHLSNYADLILNAKEMVCMIFPFNIEDEFRNVFADDKEYLRYILFEKAAEAKSVKSNDRDLMVTAGAVLSDPVEQWVREMTASTTTEAGIRYVHNKFFLIDPLSQTPIVVSGSANFSTVSITRNDENTIVVKGNTRVADIYLTEFSRMFEHFWPRYLRMLNKERAGAAKGFDKPLDETYSWFFDYYNENRLGMKRKVVFSKMKGAKESP